MKTIQLQEITLDELLHNIGSMIDEKLANAIRAQAKPQTDQFLSRAEVIKQFKLSSTTLHWRIKDGTIRCKRIGRRVLFLESELREDLDKCKINY